MSEQRLHTRIESVRYDQLQQLGEGCDHENARFMKPQVFKRLVANIRRDGCLTSLPLIAQIEGEKPLYIASGNHRVAAAIEADVLEGLAMRIVEPISEQRFVAIQLGHNAIEGEDDPATLKRLYEQLDLELKEYSGLTDNAFSTDDFAVTTFGGVAAMYQDVVFSFLSEDAEVVKTFLANAERWIKRKRPVYAAHYKDFEDFFATVVKAKEVRGITNTAIAMRVVIDIARERLEEEEREQDERDPEAA